MRFSRNIGHVLPKAAVAAHMAVHCRGARQVQLLEKSATIIEISENQGEEAELDMMKAVADATASRKIDVFLVHEHYCRKLQELCVYEVFTWTLGFALLPWLTC